MYDPPRPFIHCANAFGVKELMHNAMKYSKMALSTCFVQKLLRIHLELYGEINVMIGLLQGLLLCCLFVLKTGNRGKLNFSKHCV